MPIAELLSNIFYGADLVVSGTNITNNYNNQMNIYKQSTCKPQNTLERFYS
jgi:hypothetical protein